MRIESTESRAKLSLVDGDTAFPMRIHDVLSVSFFFRVYKLLFFLYYKIPVERQRVALVVGYRGYGP